MKTYKIRKYESFNDERELIETFEYKDKKQAEVFFEKLSNEKSKIVGKGVELELFEYIDGENWEIIKWCYTDSAELPSDTIIMTCRHLNFLNYAYEIENIRCADIGETYADLLPEQEKINCSMDIIFDNWTDLGEQYKNSNYIFGKIQKGEQVVVDFLNDCIMNEELGGEFEIHYN